LNNLNSFPSVDSNGCFVLQVSNIKHHKNDKAGSTHFELLVDKSD